MSQNLYTKYFTVSWQELHRDAKALAWKLLSEGPWEGIITITRGGLVPAAIISRELDLRLVDTICVSSYDHKNRGDIKVLKSIEGDGEGFLLIDDLVDTGATARAAKEILPQSHFATVYVKPDGRPLVDTFITEVS